MYRIREEYLPVVQEELAKLNKRAAKLGVTPAVLTVTGEEREPIKNIFGHVFGHRVYKLVTVTGEQPKLDGWKLVAAAEYGFGVEELCREAESERFGSSRGVVAYDVDSFLTTASVAIRRLGWVSRQVTREQGEEGSLRATADLTVYLLSPTFNAEATRAKEEFIRVNELVADERDAKLAADALAWGKELPTDQSDYLDNLGVASRLGYVTPKTVGLVASLIAAYQRYLDREEALRVQRVSTADRKHLGTVGQREGFVGLTVESIRSYEGDYGVRTMVRFEDSASNVLVWWTSGTDFSEGQTLDVTGTVKKHDDYKGTPQTLLSRVVKGLPKVKGKKKLSS